MKRFVKELGELNINFQNTIVGYFYHCNWFFLLTGMRDLNMIYGLSIVMHCIYRKSVRVLKLNEALSQTHLYIPVFPYFSLIQLVVSKSLLNLEWQRYFIHLPKLILALHKPNSCFTFCTRSISYSTWNGGRQATLSQIKG